MTERELEIYFGGAVRGGGASVARLAARIDALSTLGHVLTEHMASPRTLDLGARDDAAIHAHDQALLARADVFIADCSVPSTGTGYMVARAAARGLPVLCLHEAGQKASAMIAGAPDVTTAFYADEAGFLDAVRTFLLAHAGRLPRTRGPRVFLAGPPGSGKGTLGVRLAADGGAPHISTGALLRALLAGSPEHPHAQVIAARMRAGQLVPAEIMRDLVAERLDAPDCRTFGFVLDGYPPSRADLANLTERGIAPDLVLYLDCSDEVAIARQAGRGERETDTPERARERLAVFHAAGAGFDSLATEWYPDRLVVRVDAEKPPDAVLAFARETLRNLFAGGPRTRSYFPAPPARPADTRSTRVHLHVDAPDAPTLRGLAREILVRHKPAQGQLKLYPIDGLALGPQRLRLPIYARLPNFHRIEAPGREAFLTGRLGDGDRALMETALAVVAERGGMAELEEYAFERTLLGDGTVRADAEYPLADPASHRYPEHDAALLPDLPAWELHHGFDLPKGDPAAAPPLTLDALVAASDELDLDCGGWFLFAKHDAWAYRTNEFSDGALADAEARLQAQAQALLAFLTRRGLAAEIGHSLERVHGIWVF